MFNLKSLEFRGPEFPGVGIYGLNKKAFLDHYQFEPFKIRSFTDHNRFRSRIYTEYNV
jgi:hypothetical protein